MRSSWARAAFDASARSIATWGIVGGPVTEGLVNAEVLTALGPDAVVVNISISRESVINEDALIAALQNGTIRAAALDVFRNESRVDKRLAQLDNIFPLPHIGSATIETRAAMVHCNAETCAPA